MGAAAQDGVSHLGTGPDQVLRSVQDENVLGGQGVEQGLGDDARVRLVSS